MASGVEQFCDICSLRHLAIKAVEWCPECDEFLCEQCKEHHALAKSTRKHSNVLLGNLQKLPSFVKSIDMSCSEHEERFLYFCNDHESPCCVECVKLAHENCRNLSPIQKVVQDCKNSTSFSDLERTVSDLLENYENIIRDRKDYFQSLDGQKILLLQTVKSTREAFNDYLNKLEIELTETIEKSVSRKKDKTQSLLKDIKSRKEKAVDFREHIEVIKNDATDFQTFMAMQHLSKSVFEEDSKLQQMFTDNSLRWTQFTITPTKIQNMADCIRSLGGLNIATNPCKVNIVDGKHKQAQLFGSSCSIREVKNIQLREQSSFRIPKVKNGKIEILDSVILPNGKMVFSDRHNMRLVVYGPTNSFEREIVLIFQPIALTVLDSTSVVVTTSFAKKIQFVNIESGFVTKTIDTNEVICCSISKNDTLFVVENYQMGYALLDYGGKVVNNIGIDLSGPSYNAVTVIGKHLFYVNSGQNKVCCCDLQGKQVWEFKSKRLQCPYGITSDNCNVIFVVGFHSNNVFAISSDGKHFSEVVSSDQISDEAVATYYCVKSKKLLVTTMNGNVYIYEDN